MNAATDMLVVFETFISWKQNVLLHSKLRGRFTVNAKFKASTVSWTFVS